MTAIYNILLGGPPSIINAILCTNRRVIKWT